MIMFIVILLIVLIATTGILIYLENSGGFVQENWDIYKLNRYIQKDVSEATRDWVILLHETELPKPLSDHLLTIKETLPNKRAFSYASSVFSDNTFTNALSKLIAIYSNPIHCDTFLKHADDFLFDDHKLLRNSYVTDAINEELYIPLGKTMDAFREKYHEYFRLIAETKENAFSYELTKDKYDNQEEKPVIEPDFVSYNIPPLASEQTPEEKSEAEFESILNSFSNK